MFSFMGAEIVVQIVRDLVPLGLENASAFLLAGSSAGGTGVMLNLDRVQNLVHHELGMTHLPIYLSINFPNYTNLVIIIDNGRNFPNTKYLLFNKLVTLDESASIMRIITSREYLLSILSLKQIIFCERPILYIIWYRY